MSQKIKLTGPRSVESKLKRIAAEFRNDAERVLREHPEHGALADNLQYHAKALARLAQSMGA